MKNSNDNIGNRTRDLPTRSAVPQPTALRRAPEVFHRFIKTNTVLFRIFNPLSTSKYRRFERSYTKKRMTLKLQEIRSFGTSVAVTRSI